MAGTDSKRGKGPADRPFLGLSWCMNLDAPWTPAGHARTKRLAKTLAQELAAAVPGCEDMYASEIAEHVDTLIPITNRYRD